MDYSFFALHFCATRLCQRAKIVISTFDTLKTLKKHATYIIRELRMNVGWSETGKVAELSQKTQTGFENERNKRIKFSNSLDFSLVQHRSLLHTADTPISLPSAENDEKIVAAFMLFCSPLAPTNWTIWTQVASRGAAHVCLMMFKQSRIFLSFAKRGTPKWNQMKKHNVEWTFFRALKRDEGEIIAHTKCERENCCCIKWTHGPRMILCTLIICSARLNFHLMQNCRHDTSFFTRFCVLKTER